MTIFEFNRRFPTEDSAIDFIVTTKFKDGYFGLTIGRLTFGCTFDGSDVCVEYYINRKPQNDWFDWLIQESTNNKSKVLKSALSLMDRMNYLYK